MKESNETTTAFHFDDEDCEYLIIASDKNIKFPKHFLQYVCDDLSSIPKEIDLSEVPGEVITTIFALYLPRIPIDTRSKIFKRIKFGDTVLKLEKKNIYNKIVYIIQVAKLPRSSYFC